MRSRGFTLIELSIVLVIIGLIVGGVMVGREMIGSAEIRGTISQIEKYKAAYQTFKLKYNCIPGDCATAGNFGLPAGRSTAVNGDGDGQIYSFYDGTVLTPHPTIERAVESYSASAHLGGAGLIERVYNASSGTSTSNIPIKGGYMWFSSLRPASPSVDYTMPDSSSNYLYIGTWALNNPYPGSSWPVLTVSQAYNIDAKMDDGLPMSGAVRASTWYTICMGNSMPSGVGACFNTPYRTSQTGLYGATPAASAPVNDSVTPPVYYLNAPPYTGSSPAYQLLTQKLSVHIRVD